MSLNIDLEAVEAVLLADGWHQVRSGSFDLDAYEFTHGSDLVHGGGGSGVCATGFTFTEAHKTLVEDESGELVSTVATVVIAGPLTSILAVQFEGEP